MQNKCSGRACIRKGTSESDQSSSLLCASVPSVIASAQSSTFSSETLTSLTLEHLYTWAGASCYSYTGAGGDGLQACQVSFFVFLALPLRYLSLVSAPEGICAPQAVRGRLGGSGYITVTILPAGFIAAHGFTRFRDPGHFHKEHTLAAGCHSFKLSSRTPGLCGCDLYMKPSSFSVHCVHNNSDK